LAKGQYGFVTANAVDAAGVPILGKTPAWASSSDGVVIASDTGIVYGKAEGTAKVYATIDGHRDSATVTVVAGSIDTTSGPGQSAVPSFDLTAQIRGSVAGPDTSNSQVVAGATVKLVRTGGVHGDTLATAIDAGSAVSDANGIVSFKGLTGGSYTVEITPPAGSGYAPLRTGFPAPRVTDFHTNFVLLSR
jgi:hypothetical protein